MATVVEYDVKLNTQQADKAIDNVSKSINGVKSSVDELTNSLGESMDEIGKIGTEADSLEKVEKNAQKATKAVKGTGDVSKVTKTGIQGIGTALKALGIGLIIAVVAKFTEILTQNQKVADFLSTAMESLSIVLSDLVNFIVEPTNAFDNFGKLIKNVVTNNIANLMNSLGLLGTTLKKFITGDFSGAADSAKEFGNSIKEFVTEGVQGTIDVFNYATTAVSNYGSEVLKTAKANVELGNNAIIAAASLRKQLAELDRSAELQRQIRDDDTKSFEERLAASKALEQALNDREAVVRKLTGAQIALAAAELEKNNNVENQAALIDAQAEREASLAEITGQRSEQLAAQNALIKENTALIESEGQKALELKRSQAEKDRELDLELQELKAETDAEIFEAERQRILNEQMTLLEDKKLTDEQRVKIEQITAEKIKKVNEEEAAAKLAIEKTTAKQKLDILASTAGNVIGLLGETSVAAKAAGIATATINTYQGVTEVFKTPTTIPEPFGTIAKIANAAVIAASGFAAVKKIVSTKTPGKGGGGGGAAPSFSGGGGAPTPSIPSSATVSTPSFSNIQDAVPQTQNNNTVRAYVVQGDVEDSREANAKINQRRSF